jgi:hypothetical protein
MYVQKQHKIGWLVVCSQCQYGPNDLTNVVKDITQNHNVFPKTLDISGKVIPLRTCHRGTQDFRKKWGGSIKKKMYRTKFTIKTLYLLKYLLELCFIQ